MTGIRIIGKPEAEIIAHLEKRSRGVMAMIDHLHATLENYPRREIWDYQAAFLYLLATTYNRKGASIFEIGTCWGWSAAVMATGAPLAQIVTCTPNPNHVKIARRNLAAYPQIEVVESRSVDLLDEYDGEPYDMIFVDGDHEHIHDDIPWWNNLAVDGLMVFHDYTPSGAPRECQPVFAELNAFQKYLKREPDTAIIDKNGTGMVGWYRLASDRDISTEYIHAIH